MRGYQVQEDVEVLQEQMTKTRKELEANRKKLEEVNEMMKTEPAWATEMKQEIQKLQVAACPLSSVAVPRSDFNHAALRTSTQWRR